VKSNAPQGRRTPKRFREFRECCAYVPACGVGQPRCRFPNCRAFLWTPKAFGSGATGLQQSVTKGLILTIRALRLFGSRHHRCRLQRWSRKLCSGIGDPGSRRRFATADGAADGAAATEPGDRMRSAKSVWRVRELRYIPRRKINDHDSS
jgi:hypothetical protein